MLFKARPLGDRDMKVVKRIEEIRQRLKYATGEARVWGGLLRRFAFAKAIQGSNSIEGFDVTIEDAVAAADNDEPLTADGEDWAAVTSYRDAMTYVLQLADDPHFRSALRAYMEWAVVEVLSYSPHGSRVPERLPLPRWGWNGLE